ncbi:histidine phosphatase family protein [Luteipulveratus sp. YIM 133132]|uniref:Histidine phosphatase family protein n=1 Tax=Luteipulveratus flavus TaxID=3031728 RepID=A0ABT6C3T9_9MICO|nr:MULTISPECIES: histidine phosphatase family protein [unclassified Luteipulveratus]MDE9367604.1 histidine phosphatase family protein [Luteipulveratus sp. YIM 133132]MDF8263331.1 histidine phosphatase family protein [Luteipulveratus sp. YIM 133296]
MTSPQQTPHGPSERLMRSGSGRRRIVVWRHGQTTHNAAGIWQGQLDTELSDLGRQQATDAAAVIATLEPVRIVSSDLRRAAATAQALVDVTGLTPTYDDRLREIHVGEWQGLTAGDVAERYPELQDALARGQDIARGVTGETLAQVVVRAGEAVREVIDTMEEGETVVLATHGVTGRAVAAHLVGIAQDVAWMSLAGLHNCHWVEIVEHRFGWRIERWNIGA